MQVWGISVFLVSVTTFYLCLYSTLNVKGLGIECHLRKVPHSTNILDAAGSEVSFMIIIKKKSWKLFMWFLLPQRKPEMSTVSQWEINKLDTILFLTTYSIENNQIQCVWKARMVMGRKSQFPSGVRPWQSVYHKMDIWFMFCLNKKLNSEVIKHLYQRDNSLRKVLFHSRRNPSKP